jgi:ketosteroid isomerase-like protein
MAIAHSSAWAGNAAEEEVMAVTQAVCDAFRNGDLPALEQMLAPEFTLVGSDASVQPRSQAIAEVQSRDPRYEVFRNHDMTAHVYGDAAVVQGITSLKGTAGGRPFMLDVRFTDTLVRSQGRWRIVVSHVTRIPGK